MDSNLKPSKEVKAILNIAKKLKIDVKQKLNPPQIAWQLKNQKSPGYGILGTLGNFSLITGKAKSGKSFFINIAVSTASTNDSIFDRFKSNLPLEQNEVLYFDTEQSKYHVQKAVKSICQQIKVDVPTNLHTYHLRSQPPKKRLEIIEALINSNNKIGFVVIDGIKDLVTSVNDEDQASNIASKLLKWSEEHNIHIVTVLHQNPSNPKARGHLGTELVNKAETVLSVTKDNDIFIVESTESRNKPSESFAFEITNDLPVIIEKYKVKKKVSDNGILDDSELHRILSDAFTIEGNFLYKKLIDQLRLSYKKLQNKTIGYNKAVDLIKRAKFNGFLHQETDKGPYTLVEFDNYKSDEMNRLSV